MKNWIKRIFNKFSFKKSEKVQSILVRKTLFDNNGTLLCVKCGNLADVWSGHVHTLSGTVFAGFCDLCYDGWHSSPKEHVIFCTSPRHSCYGFEDGRVQIIVAEDVARVVNLGLFSLNQLSKYLVECNSMENFEDSKKLNDEILRRKINESHE